jgi:hypothetical protein
MDSRISSLIKPTLKTKFHVDFEWWKSQDSNWKVYLQAFLCPEHQKLLADYSYTDQIDLIDSTTGEVTRVDALLYTLTEHCAKQPDFLSGKQRAGGHDFQDFPCEREYSFERPGTFSLAFQTRGDNPANNWNRKGLQRYLNRHSLLTLI